MFTGIVAEMGRVRSIDPTGRILIEAGPVLDDLQVGGSIAVNGCCLTATATGPGSFEAQAVGETLRRTNLADLSAGDPVNLERPLVLGGSLDGHLVQGHVDGTGEVRSAAPDLEIAVADDLLTFMVEKGSITVDGVSLTVVAVGPSSFTVAVIPHTAEVTTLGLRRPGERVNLEIDVVAKYVARLVAGTGRL